MEKFQDKAELVQRILERDESAFRELVDNYKDMVFKVCFEFINQYEDAEDITQEVFIEVYNSIKKFRFESMLSSWIYRIALNKSLNYIRSSKFSWLSLFDPTAIKKEKINIPADDSYEADHKVSLEDNSNILMEAINSLNERQKTAFILNKLDELSYPEIAEIMDVSISSVESLLHRAKMNLQKKLYYYYKREH